jgi:hypothetical protein
MVSSLMGYFFLVYVVGYDIEGDFGKYPDDLTKYILHGLCKRDITAERVSQERSV